MVIVQSMVDNNYQFENGVKSLRNLIADERVDVETIVRD